MAEFKGGSRAGSNQVARRKPAPLVAQPSVGDTNDRAESGKAGALGGSLMPCRHGPALRMRRALLGTTSMAALGLALALVKSSFATDWTGITSTDWFTAGNWSSGVPTSSDNAFIGTNTPNATVVSAPGAQSSITFVGYAGTGTLTIENGGALTNVNGYIGAIFGSTATVTVDGAGSTWNSGTLLDIGGPGTGMLTIQNGGAVTDAVGRIGSFSGSTGTVTVDGTGSTWTNTGTLSVGDRGGTGTLTIENGGAVSNVNAYIGAGSGSTGTVIVDGVGSTWTNSTSLTVGHSGTGTLTIQSGGAVSNTDGLVGVNSGSTGIVTVDGAGSTWTNSATLYVGYFLGTGSLTIQNGGAVSSGAGSIGFNPFIGVNSSSTGTVTVDGAGSTWTNAGELRVGDFSTGALTIRNGGAVTNTNGFIGFNSGSTGTVTVDGAGSTWTNSGELRVGDFGTGTLTIQNGGAVSNAAGTIAFGPGSTGTVTVDGAGSTWTNNGNLTVGGNGTGTLTIENGGAVNNTTGFIGFDSGSTGTVTVDGAGSTWANSNLLAVGDSGSGTLTIQNGGAVSSGFGYVGAASGSTGTVTVDGAGSTWTNSGSLRVGVFGTGTLTIENGGAVSNIDGFIGYNSGSTGTVTVDGAGSTWTNSGFLYVGHAGTGTLTIENGGAVSDGVGTIGAISGSTGTVTVDGAGSTWTNSGSLLVGDSGTGTLTIRNGGAVSNTDGYIGLFSGSTGTVTVDGAGSTWTNSGSLLVGNAGTGTLTIENGGAVTNTAGYIGVNPGSTGTVTVDGAGSTWTNSRFLRVGNNGTGTLTIRNGGLVDGAVVIAPNAGSTGTVNIGAGLADAAAAPGVLGGASVAFGDGTGSLVFNHTDSDYIFAPAISGSGSMTVKAGTTILSGDSSGFSGTTTVNGGTLKVNSTLGGLVDVLGGTLGGDGTLLGALSLGSGGTLAPGNSIGTITVNNAVTFLDGSTYLVEVDSAGNSDKLVSTDVVTIQNAASVHVTPETAGENGSTYGLNTTYTIVTAANGVSGTFGSVTDDFAFLDALLSYDPNNVHLALNRNDLSFADFGETANQKAAADGAESLGSGNAVYDAILGLGAGQAPGAFDALSGEVHASTMTALLEGSRFTRQTVLGRARTAFGGEASGDGQMAALGVADMPDVASSDSERFALWVNAFGSWANWDGDDNAAGLDRSIGGVLVGGDAMVVEGLRLGLFTGYSHTDLDVDARRSSASIDSAHLGAYAAGEWGGLGLRLGGEYSWNDVETERSVAFAGFSDQLSADYDTGAAQVFGEVGYRLDLGTASIEPFVNAAYVHLDMDGFSENGGDAALQARGQSTDATFTTLGLRAELPVALGEASGRLHGMAGWRHAFDDSTPDTTLAFSGGDSFTVSGVPLAKDTAVLEAGFELDLGANASLGISYDGTFGSGFSDQGVHAGFKLAF